MRRRSSHLPLRVGVFNGMEEADRAIRGLLEAGFPAEHISVICPTCPPEKYQDLHREEPAGSHTRPAVLGGAAIGSAVLGGLTAAATVATGGTALLVAGPLLVAAGGGAVAGGLVGAMLTRGMEREEANYYDQALQKGKVLVAVEHDGPDREERLAAAERILCAAGAEPLAMERG